MREAMGKEQTRGYDLDALQTLAMRIGAEAAAVHRAGYGRAHLVDTKSSPTDMVSEVDREAERVMVSAIKRERPDDAILGEEGTAQSGTSGVRWILDPLDGTTNYLYGYPAFGVAIGVEIAGRRALGVVHDSCHDWVYAGVVGRSATCNGERLAVSAKDELATALLATGFSPRPEVRARQAAGLARVLPQIRDVRRSGSPILDLCAVAAGRVDGFYEIGLAPWDIAAGAAIAEAAGAAVAVLPVVTPPGPLLVVANPILMPSLLHLLREAGVLGA